MLKESLTSEFSEADLEFQKQSLLFEYEDKMQNPDDFLKERLLETALPCALGNPAIPEPSQIQNVSLKRLTEFRNRNVCGPRLVVGGTGVEHEELVAVSRELFSGLSDIQPSRNLPVVYRPGDCVIVEDPKWKARQVATGAEICTRVQIGFLAPALTSPEFYAASVLMALMGGGSSFSSGGPGKGMHSRLNLRVLNRWEFCQEAKSFLTPFEDVSIFGITCKCDPYASVSMMEVMVAELLLMAREISDVEFMRAKNKLKSDMFMDLESRIVQIDDLLRQVIMWNKRISSAEHAKRIDALTKADLRRVARQMLSGEPVVAVHGPKESVQVVPGSKRISLHLNSMLKE